jgi:hypothetical protein
MSYIEQTKSEIIEAYLFLRKNNQTIPSETLEFMKDSSLKALDQAINYNSCCVNKPSKETQVIEVKQKDRKEAFKIEVEQLGSYRCPSWERCKNICEECAFVNGISTT